MKKLIPVAVLFTVFAALTPLFAQQIPEGKESEFYYQNVAAEKIYPSKGGYIVVYRKGVNKMAQAYLPNAWFTDAGGRAELVTLPPGKNWPSLSVYYKNGEFSHVRLFIHPWKAHPTWGNVPSNANIDSRFEGVESVELF